MSEYSLIYMTFLTKKRKAKICNKIFCSILIIFFLLIESFLLTLFWLKLGSTNIYRRTKLYFSLNEQSCWSPPDKPVSCPFHRYLLLYSWQIVGAAWLAQHSTAKWTTFLSWYSYYVHFYVAMDVLFRTLEEQIRENVLTPVTSHWNQPGFEKKCVLTLINIML